MTHKYGHLGDQVDRKWTEMNLTLVFWSLCWIISVISTHWELIKAKLLLTTARENEHKQNHLSIGAPKFMPTSKQVDGV